MNRVLIIGGGFAGLGAARELRRYSKTLDIILVDKRKRSDFLPMLPDIIGGAIDAEFMSFGIQDFAGRYGFKFVNKEIVSLDLETRTARGENSVFNYDYLIIACGSQTNFYGNENIEALAYKLDGVTDAKRLIAGLENDQREIYVISGGGYTGVEIATNLRLYWNKRGRNKRIIIIEREPSLLGPLPQWMKSYVEDNLRKLNIEVFLNRVVEKVEEKRIFLSGNMQLNNSGLVWAAGVKIPDFMQNLNIDKTPQGRIRVDEFLRIDKNCFVVGDAANFLQRDRPLRMAVQFSIFQGRCAAKNLINSIYGRKLKIYKPRDLGYIVPMANRRSCGAVLGVNLKGISATLLHYLMCIYRSFGIKNKLGVLVCLMGFYGKINKEV